jgi:hypothetical protein
MINTDTTATDKWAETTVKLHQLSAKAGEWDGCNQTAYFRSCTLHHWFRGLTTIFTRDVGYHTSGWWKNPDYERCLHLSLSFFDPMTRQRREEDKSIRDKLIASLFSQHKRWIWVEPPYSDTGKALGVWHYRLFCNAGWNPIMPRGEVYDRELTECGWHSYSDVQDAVAKTGRNPNLPKRRKR